MPRPHDTIAALATPVGTSAIAVIRASGPDTADLTRSIFGTTPPPRLVTRADYRDSAGILVDDVLVTFFQGPRSYTGDDSLEVSCHGNPFIAQRILEDLFARGCRPAQPGEFTQRAFLNGQMDLTQAEAVMDMIHARGERALTAANQQLRGSLGRHMKRLTDLLLGILAHIEAYIDFPEEDLPPEDRELVANDLQKLSGLTNNLLVTSHYGEILRDGIKTVIVGAPNAGKSSLLNRLVGKERALVSPEPGTTRDFIEERILLGNNLLRLIDTAGLNPKPSPLEYLGIEKTLERVAEADLFLIVIDGSQVEGKIPEELRPYLNGRNSIIVLNKNDLHDFIHPLSFEINAPIISISAMTGDGITSLIAALERYSEVFRRDLGDEVIAINARHAQALAQAQKYIATAQTKLIEGDSLELLASDLRATLSSFGEISGKVDSEEMLDVLFGTFCIGK